MLRNFGRIQEAMAPRQIQFALKFLLVVGSSTTTFLF